MSDNRLAVIAGGPSFEREVSLRSGSRMTEALSDEGWEVERLDLDGSLVERLADRPPRAAVLALHGQAGEDGTVQGLLDLLGVPYTGPDPSASALVWDKNLCKGVLFRGGVDTPPWVTVGADAIRDLNAPLALERLPEELGDRRVIKPARGGACLGVRVADREDSISDALLTALRYDTAAVIERYVEGTEVAVALLEGEPLPPVEVVPLHGSYDFAARYTHGATELFAPARVSDEVLQRCQDAAVRAWGLTGCRDIARADFIVDADGRPWLLEIDTCPGMTETSLVPMAVGAAGWSFQQFCGRLVGLALTRA